jgi:c-di-GMP-binding flagellar brake protein YcgR
MTDDERIVRNPGQINSILRRLLRGRYPLTVRLPGHVGEYRSLLIELDTDRRRLQLDELNPERGHDQVRVGMPVRVISNAGGVETRFTAEIEHIGLDNAIHYYVAPIPEEVFYHQRRQFVRVPLPMAMQEQVTLYTEDDNAIPVRITDLSAGGFGGQIVGNSPLHRNGLHRVEMRLRGYPVMEAEAEIRFVKEDRLERRQVFGAQFMGMKPPQRRALERVVLAVQRKLLRET